jgi:membrane associated rhomboid family serine protease
MLPIRDVIPSRTAPGVTLAVAIGILVVWFALWLRPDDALRLILTYGVTPAHSPPVSRLASLFLHTALVPGAANALALWIFGGTLEDRLGHGRFLLFYLAAGLAGTALAVSRMPDGAAPLLGASGAVSGVIGGYLVLFPRSRVLVLVPLWRDVDLVEIPAAVVAAMWLIVELVWRFSTDNPLIAGPAAHAWTTLGGAVAGMALVWLLKQPARQRVEWWGD